MPDLSWVPLDREPARRTNADTGERPELTGGTPALRLTAFWEQGHLFDEHGNEFHVAHYWNQTSAQGGWQGELAFFCPAPPLDPGSFTLRLGDLDIVISFDSADRGLKSEPRFLAGYPGQASAVPFHGGAIKVIAALVFTDKVVIEWLVRPIPDLSWIPFDEEKLTDKLTKVSEEDKQEFGTFVRESKRLSDLWHGALVADDLGTNYVSSTGSAFTIPGGHKGENAFLPNPPVGARELNITVEDLSVSIPLTRK
jgi:hypothetical protein